MRTVLIINHRVEECGVQKYGVRFFDCCSNSSLYNFVYLEPESEQELLGAIKTHKPFCIIYNYLDITMPWFSYYTFAKIKEKGIKQGLIVHNTGYNPTFDFFLHQNPDHVESGNNFALTRLLYKDPKISKQDSDIINIGTFGFGFWGKRPELMCQLINDQFVDEKVCINMHLTVSHFFPNHQELNDISRACHTIVSRPNIKLNITSDFISDEEILNFLSQQDLNIFLYKNYEVYNGISSTVDYALSVDRPIALCKSSMFSHMNKHDEICVEKTPLKDIILSGNQIINQYRDKWSRQNFIKTLENIISKI